MKRRRIYFLFFIMILICSFTSFFHFGLPENSNRKIQKNFTCYLDDLFADWVSADSITLHYHLANPKQYGIQESSPNLSGSYFSNANDYEKELDKLHTFSPSKLNDKQQKLYHILEDYLTRKKNVSEFPLHQTIFSPTTGLQAQLPVTLCEYPLRTEEDLLIYLQLLEQIPDYFQKLFQIEQEKSSQGLFICDSILDQILSQMDTFLKEKEENPLITTFSDRLKNLSLGSQKKKLYIKKNKKLILHTVLPAYRTLMQNLLSLKGTSTNDLGLCYYDRGKEYYCALISSLTGSDKAPKQLIQMTEENISSCYKELEEILYLQPEAYDQFLNSDISKCVPSSEKEILNWLKQNLPDDFPSSTQADYKVKSVPECLESYVSPAFYMIPSIDASMNNTIYLNKKQLSYLSSPYNILAHEGYPGHLYQTTYFYQHLDHPIHSLCDYDGYVEGWAVYAENLSYEFLDFGKYSKTVARLYQINHILNLAIPSRIDLGIHYEGWNRENVNTFLSTLGLEKEETSMDIFDTILAEPGNYLSYYIGFLEILSLEQDYNISTKKNNKNNHFYQHFLSTGPCDFSYLEKLLTSES